MSFILQIKKLSQYLLDFRSQAIAVDSPGKSGATFYQSYDKLFIIKSLIREEVEKMHPFLKQYYPVSYN